MLARSLLQRPNHSQHRVRVCHTTRALTRLGPQLSSLQPPLDVWGTTWGLPSSPAIGLSAKSPEARPGLSHREPCVSNESLLEAENDALHASRSAACHIFTFVFVAWRAQHGKAVEAVIPACVGFGLCGRSYKSVLSYPFRALTENTPGKSTSTRRQIRHDPKRSLHTKRLDPQKNGTLPTSSNYATRLF